MKIGPMQAPLVSGREGQEQTNHHSRGWARRLPPPPPSCHGFTERGPQPVLGDWPQPPDCPADPRQKLRLKQNEGSKAEASRDFHECFPISEDWLWISMRTGVLAFFPLSFPTEHQFLVVLTLSRALRRATWVSLVPRPCGIVPRLWCVAIAAAQAREGNQPRPMLLPNRTRCEAATSSARRAPPSSPVQPRLLH